MQRANPRSLASALWYVPPISGERRYALIAMRIGSCWPVSTGLIASGPIICRPSANSHSPFHFTGTASMCCCCWPLQSWSIHHDSVAFHAPMALSVSRFFTLFPRWRDDFRRQGRRFVSPPSPFYSLYPPRLAWLISRYCRARLVLFPAEISPFRRQALELSLATAVSSLPPIFADWRPLRRE